MFITKGRSHYCPIGKILLKTNMFLVKNHHVFNKDHDFHSKNPWCSLFSLIKNIFKNGFPVFFHFPKTKTLQTMIFPKKTCLFKHKSQATPHRPHSALPTKSRSTAAVARTKPPVSKRQIWDPSPKTRKNEGEVGISCYGRIFSKFLGFSMTSNGFSWGF